jgi:hypothetical protein
LKSATPTKPPNMASVNHAIVLHQRDFETKPQHFDGLGPEFAILRSHVAALYGDSPRGLPWASGLTKR